MLCFRNTRVSNELGAGCPWAAHFAAKVNYRQWSDFMTLHHSVLCHVSFSALAVNGC